MTVHFKILIQNALESVSMQVKQENKLSFFFTLQLLCNLNKQDITCD